MQRDHLDKMERTKTTHQQDIEDLKNQLSKSHDDYIQTVRKKYQDERSDLKKDHEKLMEDCKSRYETDMYSLKENHSNEINSYIFKSK